MIIDQLTPLLPKDSEDVNALVKRLQMMMDVATMVDPALHRRDRGRIKTLTTDRARGGTRPAASLPRRSTNENEIKTPGTWETLSAIEMHTTGLKTDAKSKTASSTNNAMEETMITMVLTMISLTDNEGRGAKLFSTTLRWCVGP
jgi:hypothetical protein